jgi:hypothetical protein
MTIYPDSPSFDPRRSFMDLGKPIWITFSPQPDITAYELAQILMLHDYPYFEADWAALGTLQRHFSHGVVNL